MKQKPDPEKNSRNFEEIVIPSEKRQETLNDLKQILQTKSRKISKLLNNSTVLNSVRKK